LNEAETEFLEEELQFGRQYEDLLINLTKKDIELKTEILGDNNPTKVKILRTQKEKMFEKAGEINHRFNIDTKRGSRKKEIFDFADERANKLIGGLKEVYNSQEADLVRELIEIDSKRKSAEIRNKSTSILENKIEKVYKTAAEKNILFDNEKTKKEIFKKVNSKSNAKPLTAGEEKKLGAFKKAEEATATAPASKKAAADEAAERRAELARSDISTPYQPKKVPSRTVSATERLASSASKGVANLLGLRTKGASKTEQQRKESSTKGVAAFIQGKKGRGMRTITDKVLEPISRWIQVGKLKYNNRLLDEKQMFSVKYPSGAVNPYFSKNVAVSDLFYELMKNLEKSQKVDTRILKELDPDEKKLFENLIVRSGCGRQFGIMDVSPTDEEAEKEKRLAIVKGHYLAGGNSPEVINELRSLILYFIGINRIDKKTGLSTLQSIV